MILTSNAAVSLKEILITTTLGRLMAQCIGVQSTTKGTKMSRCSVNMKARSAESQ